MIGVSSSSGDFAALATYLANGRTGDESERVAWTASRNLPTDDPELVATIMRATASRNVRVVKPAYHLAISFDPRDVVDRATMERVADKVIEALGLREHQVLIVAHRDREHPHLHLLVNRVHPVTGRAWSRWQDQRVIQTVLRREEIALGLRSVPGRLAPVPEVPGTARDPDAARAPVGGRANSDGRLTSRAMKALVDDLDRHERVVDLARTRFGAQVAVAAARARLSQLEVVVTRARGAEIAFERALATMYRDPEGARRAFGAILGTAGAGAALRALRESPARLGALRTIDARRLLGLVRHTDDGPARSAAPYVVGKAREAIEAERLVWAVASEEHRRRVEDGLRNELAALYRDPDRARGALEQLRSRSGAERAVSTLRLRPAELGELLPAVQSDEAKRQTHARTAALMTEALVAAHAGGRADAMRVRTANLAGELASVLDAARSDVRRASDEEGKAGRALRELPGRRELERRITHGLARLLPREVATLKTVLTSPQLAIVRKLRAAARDAVLQREEELV